MSNRYPLPSNHNQTLPVSLSNEKSDSTITQLLLDIPKYAKTYKIRLFAIHDCANANFKLAAFEVLFIADLKRGLCKQ